MGRLANATEYEFDEGVCERGTDYYRSGAVRIVEGNPLAMLARVRGSREYTVKLGLREGALFADCDCPYFSADFCKHVWAVILAADGAGHLRLPPMARDVPLRRYHTVDPNEARVATPNSPGLGKTAGHTARNQTHDIDFDDDEACPIDDDIEVDDEADDLSDEDDLSSYGDPVPKKTVKAPNPHEPQRIYQSEEPWRRELDRMLFLGNYSNYAVRGRLRDRYELHYVLNAVDNAVYDRLYLCVELMQCQKNGNLKRGPRGIDADSIRALLDDPADRRLYSLLSIKQTGSYSYSSGGSKTAVFGESLNILLPELCRTGRFFLTSHQGEMTRLHLDEGAPWAFRIEVVRDDRAKDYVVRGVLQRDGERRSLAEAVVLNLDGWVILRDTVARFVDARSNYWVTLMRQDREIRAPLSEGHNLQDHLCRLPHLPPVDWPDELRMKEIVLTPRPSLKIKPSYRTKANMVSGELFFQYEDYFVPALPPLRIIRKLHGNLAIRRDPAAEEAAVTTLTALGFRQPGNATIPELHSKHVPEAVRTLLAQGWRVEAEGKLYRQPGPFKIEVSSGIDWFELQGSCDFDGLSVALPALLEALRKGDGMVQLGDGSFGMLPETWLDRCGLLAATGKVHGDGLRYRKAQAGLLDALLAAEPQATCDEAFTRIREELHAFERIEPEDPPASFDGQLRPYQRDGLGWFRFLERFGFGGCLADDMGLGKTVEVLALLEARRAARAAAATTNGQPHTTLAVVPRSLIFNWKQEAARFAPRLRVLDHIGAERVRDGNDHFEEYDLVLTTYGTLLRDIVHLSAFEFDYVILDEAQAIKNVDTASSKAVRLLKGRHRLCLSGTPIENRLSELWSLFEFLNPGMLGAASVFQSIADGGRAAQSPNTISSGGRDARGPGSAAVPAAPDGRALLARALRPFILRRTKAQVAADLPEKTEQTIYCELDARQRAQYDEIRRYYRALLLEKTDAEEWNKSKLKILEGLLRLRQAACHPGLIDAARKGESSAKLEALMPQLEEVVGEGHKVLVFSQFTQFLAIVRKRLDAAKMTYEYLDGKTRDRQACVKRFQEDESCKLFLISLKAGGLGLNLTAAEYVFLLDPWWNPAVEAQAIDRAHRIGQTRQVFAYRLIARDTVEEKVLELQRSKRLLADAIVNADNSLIRDIGPADLELLLG